MSFKPLFSALCIAVCLGLVSCQKEDEHTPAPQPEKSVKTGEFIYHGVSYFEPLDGDKVYINPILNTLLTSGKDHTPVVHSFIMKENGKVKYFLFDTAKELNDFVPTQDTPPAGRTNALYFARCKIYKGNNFNGTYVSTAVESRDEIRAYDLPEVMQGHVGSVEIFNDGSESIILKFSSKDLDLFQYGYRTHIWTRKRSDHGLTESDLTEFTQIAKSYKFGYPVDPF